MVILGIDEVGRGPWAGPLVVGAVVLRDGFDTSGLMDSKKLTARRREELNKRICGDCGVGLGWVEANELDEIGLSEALRVATRRAVEGVKMTFHEVVIDGTVNFLRGTKLEKHVSVLPKADALVPAVSAASIVAKVARDRHMVGLAGKYPGYGFEKHVGYGTATHRRALAELGLTPEHRRSFRPIAEMNTVTSSGLKKSTTEVGKMAEGLVVDYLTHRGHEILDRNWKTKFCEIDIVSSKGGRVYFIEVKYRRRITRGSGLEAIDADKQRRLKMAAEAYCAMKGCGMQPMILCAAVHGVPPKVESVVVLR